MQENITITKKERLMIAAQQLAGMQPEASYIQENKIPIAVRAALDCADELITQSGCIVAGAEVPEYAMD